MISSIAVNRVRLASEEETVCLCCDGRNQLNCS